MNKKLLDILVCPFDKVSSLELFQFKVKANHNSLTTIVDNEEPDSQNTLTNEKQKDQKTREPRTSTKSPSISEMNQEPCEIVEEGLLLCRTCLRFYPITEEIPIILPDELRDKKKDISFLKTWNESIPIDLLKNLKPWTL
jgi:uncharacterized protein YbaR (Trm112 family)